MFNIYYFFCFKKRLHRTKYPIFQKVDFLNFSLLETFSKLFCNERTFPELSATIYSLNIQEYNQNVKNLRKKR